MSPRFSISTSVKKNIEHKNPQLNEDEDNDSDVNPFDDEEFSEVGDNDDFDDDEEEEIEEVLEQENGGQKSKRKFNEVDDDENESPSKKKKAFLSKKPPTAEEMTRLRETEHLFHSNLFRMQIEEVLLEVKPKKKDKNAIKIWLEKFIKYLSEPPESPSVYSLDNHEWLKDTTVQYPLPFLPEDSKGKFKFVRPSSVQCYGSFKSDRCLGPNYSVDIFVIMPNDFFQKEDYLNARYYKKRALYLCHIAKHLMKSTALDSTVAPQFCVRSENPLKPILLLKPSAQWSSKIKVYVHAIPESGSFKLSRFSPTKNNVRRRWWFNGLVENDDLISTPHYNADIAQDLVVEIHESFFNSIYNDNPNLKDALLLLKVWLHQRELYESSGGFSGFLLTSLIAHLFKSLKLNSQMSSYQVLRNTWLALSQTDWSTLGPSLAQNESEGVPLNEFHSLYEVVFVDLTGFVNLASNVTRTTFIRVKEEAKLALKYLDNSCLNSFQALFMTRMPFLHQFDHVISIKMKKVIQHWKNIVNDEKKELDLLADKQRLFMSILISLLEKGLGQRVSQIAVQCGPPSGWSISNSPPNVLWDSMSVGLKLNPELALSVVEKGPEANLKEGAEFRNFWSPKSELRRFQDGCVCESIVWDVPEAPFSRRRLITQSIVEFLLNNKLHLTKNSFIYVSNQLELLVKDKSLPVEVGASEELSLKIIKSLDDLTKKIRDVTLPLPVTSVLGISPALRFTDVFPPTAHEGFSKCLSANGHLIIKEIIKKKLVSTDAVEAVIQLGLSKKWPENVEAIRRIRAAFVIEIGKALSERWHLKTQPFPDYLRVFKDGYVFKLKVVYPREISLMKEIITPDGLTAYRDTPESLKMEQNLLHLPKLTGTLHGLSQEFPGYGPTTCLVKRWLRAQMLDDELFPDIAIELIVASQFISPEPFTVNMQPQTAFFRVLSVLANTNWCLEPIIINFNGELSREDITEIEQTFRSGRESDSLPGLFIATSYDKTGVVWTRKSPLLPVLYHTAKLAKESLTVLEKEILVSSNISGLKKLFRPPLDFYDVIIYLNLQKIPRRAQGIDWEEVIKSGSLSSKHNAKNIDPIVDFCPVQCYLQELRENFGEFALFFNDAYGGDVIGVIFKPSVNVIRDFKVSHLNGRRPVFEGKEPKLIFNKEAIIEDFHHLGKNLIKNIVTKTSAGTN